MGFHVTMVGRRLLQALVVLLCISFVTFVLTYLAPGDPAIAMYEAVGITPSAEMVEAARSAMGLDRPFAVQYISWLNKIIHADFGISFSKNTAVWTLLSSRLLNTAYIAFTSLSIMLVLSLPLGVMSALKHRRWIDYAIRILTFIGISIPGFWLGLILMDFIAVRLGLVPVVSSAGDWRSLVLPSTTLGIAMASKYTRQVRTAVLEELSQDYVMGARARGLKENTIIWRHVMPNSILPLITLLGLSCGSLLGGTAVVEIIFSYPGMGNLAVNAVAARDYPLIQGFVLWIAVIYMVINLAVDLSYQIIDPRIREGR